MRLTKHQERMLNGEYGRGRAMAMQIQYAVGEGFEAERMVPVSRVHAALSAQAADIWFAEKLADAGAVCRVAPTVNPGYCARYFKEQGILDEAGDEAMARTEAAYRRLGATLSYSCTPYLFGNIPHYGEITAFSETSATIYVNSVIGARTNRESAASAICAAVTGYVPEYGMLLEKNRKANVLVEVQAEMDSDFKYALLGLMGKKIGRGVPVFTGLPADISTEALIALGAQLNVSGTFDLFHVPGVTPEAPDLQTALGGAEPGRRVVITEEEMRENLKHYSFEPGENVDYVILGCPHYTYEQLLRAEKLLGGARCCVPVWILTSKGVLALAKDTGLYDRLLELGVEVLADTCVDEACCWSHLAGKSGVTDSPKGLYYMKSFGIRMAVREMETCLCWAREGRAV